MGNTSAKRIRDNLESNPEFNRYLQKSVVDTIQPLADNYGTDLGKVYGSQFGNMYGTQISNEFKKQSQTFEKQFAQNFSQQFMNEFSKSLKINLNPNSPGIPLTSQGLNIKPAGLTITDSYTNSNYRTLGGF